MTITSIHDCKDANAFGRQAARISSLFGEQVNKIEIDGFADIQAAGNLIDILDAYEDREGIIFVNSAPRHGSAKKWKNGSPFGYFKYKNTYVFTTIDKKTLSLVKKLKLISNIHLTDIPTVMHYLEEQSLIKNEDADRIINTQYRSFEYLPKLAKWVLDGVGIPTENYNIEKIEEIGNVVWWIDNFGNVKTTILESELDYRVGETIKTRVGELIFTNRLKDVEDAAAAIIPGSSGIGNSRFLEIVVQGKSAAKHFNLSVGDEIL